MKVAIASDHAGFDYKEQIRAFVSGLGHEVVDFGTYSNDSCDYPDFIKPAAEAVAKGQCDRGIVLGGSGNGEAIAANKVRGIRCGVCWDLRSVRLTRLHNDANVIALGQRMMAIEEAFEIVDLFLSTEFEGQRHQPRIDKIEYPM